MEFVDEITKRKSIARVGTYKTILVDIVEGQYILGYTKHFENLPKAEFYIGGEQIKLYYDPKKIHLQFSKLTGKSVFVNNPIESLMHTYELGRGLYPYSFERKYEAVQNFRLFKNKQANFNDIDFPISKHVKRTIGIEFETSMGVLPEDTCFQLGLIPLRDGSISGCEYSTVILQGNPGFNLLYRQLDILNEYTHFNKDCSLHIHFGDFPLDKDKIFTLYKLLYNNTNAIARMCPPESFHTETFKSNGKSYCNKLKSYGSFETMFKDIAGMDFFGSFVQPHPLDRDRNHKWNIHSRYYFCNFVNIFCYNVNKTIEFRFLRPTYNLEKILTWIYILNAFLDYSEKYKDYEVTLETILSKVYPKELSDFLRLQIVKLQILVDNQVSNGDVIGADLILENKIFDSKNII